MPLASFLVCRFVIHAVTAFNTVCGDMLKMPRVAGVCAPVLALLGPIACYISAFPSKSSVFKDDVRPILSTEIVK